MQISYNDFEKVEMRVGKITEVQDFPEARSPSYKLRIDFGKEIGVKRSSAHVTNYGKDELLGRQVICVVNFPPKQIASTVSEVLVLGVMTEKHGISLLEPDKDAVLGTRVY